MRVLRRLLMLAALLLPVVLPLPPAGHAVASTESPGAGARYQIDPKHSSIAFYVDHLGFARTLGVFRGIEGEILFHAQDWTQSQVEAVVAIETLSLGDAAFERTMLGRRWFDAESHPQASFQSLRLQRIDAQQARLEGLLRLRGVERQVTLDLRFNKLGTHPLTLRRTLGFSATTTLRRADFGLDAYADQIGAEVEVRIEIEATLPPPRRSGKPGSAP